MEALRPGLFFLWKGKVGSNQGGTAD